MSIDLAVSSLTQSWNAMWEQSREYPPRGNRVNELHPSSFPYCGYRHARSWLEDGSDPTVEIMGSKMHYYVNVGTTVHTVLQEYMGKLTTKEHGVTGEMVGDWLCNNAACRHLVKFSTYCKCPKCGSDTQYEELGIRLYKRTHGHTDGLFRLNVHAKKGKKKKKPVYYVIDYKTSSTMMVQLQRMKGNVLPYTSNKFQIRSYIAYLETQYKIKIKGYVLIYAARDTPMKDFVMVGADMTKADRKWVAAYVRRSDHLFDLVRKHIAVRDISADDTVLNQLTRYKLCTSPQMYLNDVRDKYDPCPYFENGQCFGNDRRFLDKAIKAHNKRGKKK